MDPRLIGSKDLRVATVRRDRGSAPVALTGLLAAVAAFGVLQASLHSYPPGPAQTLTRSASVAYVPGTQVPAPPATYHLSTPAAAQSGVHIFRPTARLTPTQSRELFFYYLTSMEREGWTLLGKGDPSPTGEWTLRWQFKGQSALLSMYTAPRVKLEIDLCPPTPYC